MAGYERSSLCPAWLRDGCERDGLTVAMLDAPGGKVRMALIVQSDAALLSAATTAAAQLTQTNDDDNKAVQP